MKVLIIGGTGNISWWVAKKCVDQGYDTWIINRGTEGRQCREELKDVHALYFDYRNKEDLLYIKNKIMPRAFDVVIDFLCYNAEHAKTAIKLFKNVKQYIFISSTAVYDRSFATCPLTVSSPRGCQWDYAMDKQEAEDVFMGNESFPWTIVRPGHTYDTVMPIAVGNPDWTVPQRMIDGKPIVLHDTGNTVWSLLHSEDFANILVEFMMRYNCIHGFYNIVSQELLTWNQIHDTIAQELGAPKPEYVYILSRDIYKLNPYIGNGIFYHKQYCDIYKTYHPTTIDFKTGIRRTIKWFREKPERMKVDNKMDKLFDFWCEAYNDNLWRR